MSQIERKFFPRVNIRFGAKIACRAGKCVTGQNIVDNQNIFSIMIIEGGEKVDFSAIAQFIGTLGFPIAACCYLMYSREKDGERHKEEMDKITEALNNNTLAIQHLSDTLSNR